MVTERSQLSFGVFHFFSVNPRFILLDIFRKPSVGSVIITLAVDECVVSLDPPSNVAILYRSRESYRCTMTGIILN